MLDTESPDQIRELIKKMNVNTNDIQTFDKESRGKQIDQIVFDLSTRYLMSIDAQKAFNRSEKPEKRDKQFAFLNSLNEVGGLEKSDVPETLESRIYQSDLLLLNYLLVEDKAFDEAVKKIQGNGRNIADVSNIEIYSVMAEICVEFIKKQKAQIEEDKLHEFFPDAPTTGQELEYRDPVQYLSSRRSLCEKELAIVSIMVQNPTDRSEKIKESGLIESLQMALFADRELGKTDDQLSDKLLELIKEIGILERTAKTLRRVEVGQFNPFDTMRDITAYNYAENLKETDTDTDPIKTLFDFLQGLKPLEQGETLNAEEITILTELSPTLTKLMSLTGAFKDIKELTGRELISKPSVSIKAQLKDVLNVLRTKGLQGELSFHQTVSGVEISEEDPEFMEVYAMLTAANLIPGQDEIPQRFKDLVKEGTYLSSESFQKASLGKDGELYYFPFHRNRGAQSEANIPYLDKDENLVELRTLGRITADKDFFKYVREATFNWVCAWGKKAAIKVPETRNEDEIFFAEAWTDLITDWRKLLLERSINRPEEKEYFCKWEDTTKPKPEKYSGYILSLQIINDEESAEVDSGRIKYGDTLEHATKMLMINYRSKINGRIRNKINDRT